MRYPPKYGELLTINFYPNTSPINTDMLLHAVKEAKSGVYVLQVFKDRHRAALLLRTYIARKYSGVGLDRVDLRIADILDDLPNYQIPPMATDLPEDDLPMVKLLVERLPEIRIAAYGVDQYQLTITEDDMILFKLNHGDSQP